MSLLRPTRLPKRFNRSVSSRTRSLVHLVYAGTERLARRRHERFARFSRRTARFGNAIASEFRVWIIMILGAVAVAVAVVLFFAPFFDVRTIHIRRQDARIDLEEVQQTLAPLFRRRLILVSRAQVNSLLLEQYPDIDDVEIAKQYPSTLTVTIFTDPVVAAVHIDEGAGAGLQGSGAVVPSTQSGGTQWAYITNRGYFITSPVALAPTALEEITLTDWSVRPQNRTALFSPEFLQTVFRARDALRRDFGFSIKKITVFVLAQEFHISTNSVTLWFDLKSPLSVQFQRFRELLKSVSLDQVSSYVDLRVADKVIYK